MNDSLDRLSALQVRQKQNIHDEIQRADEVGESRGFMDRTPRKKPGRRPSPRTFQLHPKVLPEVGEAILNEVERLGTTQGHLIETLWQKYGDDL